MTFSATSVPTAGPVRDKSDGAAVVAAEAFLWASQTGSVKQDLSLITPMVDASCPCIKALADVLAVQKRNHHHLSSRPLPPATAVITKRDGDLVQLALHFVSPSFQILDAHNKTVQSYADETEVADMTVRFDGSMWKIAKFEVHR